MSDYIPVSGGEKTALAILPDYYENDLILPEDLHLTTSVLADSLSDSFPTDGTYPMWGGLGDPFESAQDLYAAYNFGGIDWIGSGTAVVSGGEIACDPTSRYWNAGFSPNNQIMPFFAIQALNGINSDDQYVQCEVGSVRSGQTMNSAIDLTVLGLATRCSLQLGGGSTAGFNVIALFFQSGRPYNSPFLMVVLLDDVFHFWSGERFGSSFQEDYSFPASWFVDWTGTEVPFSFGVGGGPTLAPGDILRLETIQTRYNVLVNGVSLLSGDLSVYKPSEPYGGFSLPNSIGGDSCGFFIRDDFNTGTGRLSVKNFSCGVLGDARTTGTRSERAMPVAIVSESEVAVTPIDVRDSVRVDAGDSEAVVNVYTGLKRMGDTPAPGIISSCTIGDHGYFLSLATSYRTDTPSFLASWGALSLSRYDPSHDTWTTLTPPPIPTLGGNSVSPLVTRGCIAEYNGLVYLVATSPIDEVRTPGYNNAESFTFVYDPNTDSWSSLAPMPLGVAASAGAGVLSVLATQAVIINGKFYFPGGHDYYRDPARSQASYVSQRHAVYDIGLDSWADETPLPYARGGACVFALGTDMFVLGGYSESTNQWDDTIYKYDTVNYTWNIRSTRQEVDVSTSLGLTCFDAACVSYFGGILVLVTPTSVGPVLVQPDGTFQRTQTPLQLNPPPITSAFGYTLKGNAFTAIGGYYYGPYSASHVPVLENYFVRIDPAKLPWVI